MQRLNALGFVWNPQDAAWEEMFEELNAYKETHDGDCNVPTRWPENPQLGSWVTKQRAKGNLSEERVQRLNALGFVWNALDAAWEEMFEELKAYKKIKGHCNVPVALTT